MQNRGTNNKRDVFVCDPETSTWRRPRRAGAVEARKNIITNVFLLFTQNKLQNIKMLII